MTSGGRVLRSYPSAPWLPPGGTAEVALAAPDALTPEPTCIVRLMATRRHQVLVVPRQDGRGLDIPSVIVGDGLVEDCVTGLLMCAVGALRPAWLLGYVRNIVGQPSATYAWPVPESHFAVWHCAVPADCQGQGQWLHRTAAQAQLSDRHWWPLAAHVLRLGT